MRFPLGFLVALRGLALREIVVLAILRWWSLSPSLLGPIGRICSDPCDFLSPGLFGRVGRIGSDPCDFLSPGLSDRVGRVCLG